MTPTDFRSYFPEFSDTAKYPDSQVEFWMVVAVSLVDPDRWGVLADQGVCLVTAHHLVVANQDQTVSAAGGIPGEVKGATASKSVDKVSVGYDTKSVTIDGVGFWNMSKYGIRYLTLARMFGAGGLQL
ncbi:DUF4054 domain-containing protein [Pandoraea sp. XJJ-1]|uniref:DUF4054 domain-containing protein n=1 Tax=Pandoraea sp. XJJ-1 TaxID=3002643 RepID=UPI002280B982|nr:DUF4054 domain-containing protein [Pandoraea sp. XJJ-1]WAL80960.1 DUF4054 domain-containing protein [Pandoraea sp. XJJ-1]